MSIHQELMKPAAGDPGVVHRTGSGGGAPAPHIPTCHQVHIAPPASPQRHDRQQLWLKLKRTSGVVWGTLLALAMLGLFAAHQKLELVRRPPGKLVM